MFGLMLMQMSTSVNKRMHMINELCKMSLCKVMIVFTYLQFDVDKLFPFEFLSITCSVQEYFIFCLYGFESQQASDEHVIN